MGKQYGENIIGKQVIGMPGSEVVAVEPTPDYLVNGPVGDGWYDTTEQRYVTTDFQVTVRLEGGRVITIPKSYQWITEAKQVCDRPTS